jgi:hypothetical protein
MNEQFCFICGANPSYKDGMCKKCKSVFGSPENVPELLDQLCHREIVKIRELTLKDDKYTSHLLGEAVGSPVGITLCVEARMQQITDLELENKRLKEALTRISNFKLGEMSDADGYSKVCEIADAALGMKGM